MTLTPAPGNEPHRPTEDGPLAPTAPGKPTIALTTPQKWLIGFVAAGAVAIAAIGFIGSYTAVTALARSKGFGSFSRIFTLGIDIGIGVFLALDLLLTWLRMPFPLLRYGAWMLTAATIAFNAVVSWPDPVGVSMHAVIPILFVIAVEAARHAIGRIADITADKHLEGPPMACWFLKPIGTFILWRRQRLWMVRKWDTVLTLEQERRVYMGKLRTEFGRSWRRKATADKLLVLRLATKDGLSITQAQALPEAEAAKQLAEANRIADQKRDAEEQRRREQEDHRREQKRLEDEAATKAEAERIANEREALALQEQQEEAARQRQIADARTRAELAEIARKDKEAEAAAEQRRRQEQIEAARLIAEEQQKAADAARLAKDNQEAARIEAERKLVAEQRTAEVRAALANREPRTANQTNAANREPQRTTPARTATKPEPANREPRTIANQDTPRTPNPANLTDRAAAKQNQITAVLELIDELGFDAATLGVVQERTGMSKTTAYHRLTEARSVWNQRQAS